jgi:hypothetical protein
MWKKIPITHYSELFKPGFKKNELIEFNRRGLTIIIPHKEGDFFNTNYNPIVAFDLGCHFVAMEFQYIDINMDYYITKFKNNSLVLKDDSLRTRRANASITSTTRPSAGSVTTQAATATTQPTTTNSN